MTFLAIYLTGAILFPLTRWTCREYEKAGWIEIALETVVWWFFLAGGIVDRLMADSMHSQDVAEYRGRKDGGQP